MKKFIVIIVILIAGWYGNLQYQQNNLPFIQSVTANFKSDEQLKFKCITKDGRVLYGTIPEETICDRYAPIKGSLTIVSSETYKYDLEKKHKVSSGIYKYDLEKKHKVSKFKCDGRQYCSQMTSRPEAEFFIHNCPNTKMDGDRDGVPCENDSRF